ncbi:hypothetical protein [Prosthecomicrobium sp. N25]|uniref:hypothetical protein n=1 Tax=Prosthecomicrobium sp. N25 TaxID=3129254 RepID=UPI003076F1FF
MDRELAEEMLGTAFAPWRDAADTESETYSVDLGEDRVLDLVRVGGAEVTTLLLSAPQPAPADAETAGDLGWAWLEATWLRRIDDGIVATADEAGRLGFGMVLPRCHATAETVEAAVAALLAAARPRTAPAADAPLDLNDGNVWLPL